MEGLTIGFAGLVLLTGFLLLRLPVGFSLAVTGFLGFGLLASFPSAFAMLSLVTYKTAASYALTVIPLFILMGQLAAQSRMGVELYTAVYRWIGFLPGGLAMATIGACAGFAAISGSSLATAATLGMVALPEMKRFHYDDALATGSVAAGGTLGILIPPSTVMIIYGILTEQPIGSLFVAGILPGLLLTTLFCLTIFLMARHRPALGPPGPRFSLKERLSALRGTWGMLVLFFLVIGGLYAGWFTPTEAAGMGAFGALTLTAVKRRLTWRTLWQALNETVLTTAMVFTILIGANIFGYFMTISRFPEMATQWVTEAGMNRYMILAVICLIYIILGCLMEGMAIMMITLPIVFPVIIGLGFDPIWFGVVVTLLMEMSLITPPVGVNVFVISGIAREVPMATIFRGILPFFLALCLCLVLLILFPSISLWLPMTMGR